MFSVSIGIMAYNEDENIGKLLSCLISQKTYLSEIIEIIVVASGCIDRTETIVEEFAKRDKRIKIIHQKKREGKASAINLFLKEAKGEIVILESADTLPYPDAVENLVKKFIDPKVGAAGVQVIPVNSSKTFMGFYVQLFWKLHHKIAKIYPKCGEMVAFRNILPEISYNTATDETWIIALLLQLGYEVSYAEDSKVINKGPETILDFLKQRRRHLVGYIHLKKELNFKPKTMDNLLVIKLLPSCIKFNFKDIFWSFGVILLEFSARVLALYDWYIRKRNPYIWDIAETTKEITLKEDYKIINVGDTS